MRSSSIISQSKFEFYRFYLERKICVSICGEGCCEFPIFLFWESFLFSGNLNSENFCYSQYMVVYVTAYKRYFYISNKPRENWILGNVILSKVNNLLWVWIHMRAYCFICSSLLHTRFIENFVFFHVWKIFDK